MKVLVVGGGGREHALCWALRRDAASAFSDDLTLFAAPGNPGTAALATNLPIAATAVDDLTAAVSQREIDVTIIGPEAPLAAVAMPALRITSFAYALDDSSCAAAADGPNTARPCSRRRSARPAASGASGPMMVTSMSCRRTAATT